MYTISYEPHNTRERRHYDPHLQISSWRLWELNTCPGSHSLLARRSASEAQLLIILPLLLPLNAIWAPPSCLELKIREKALFPKIFHPFLPFCLGRLAEPRNLADIALHGLVWLSHRVLGETRPGCRGAPYGMAGALPSSGKLLIPGWHFLGWSLLTCYAELVPLEGRYFGYSFSYIWQEVVDFWNNFWFLG